MTTTSTSTVAFKPWARAHEENNSLKDILSRVSDERGHFRDITEASLQEEIAAEGALRLSESDSDSEDDPDASGNGDQFRAARAKPTSREELFKAKYEMLSHVRAAEQEILMSLDFVSLLLSKDAPRQATNTISPVLKESVPLGSLGTDLWKRMPIDQAREAQDDLIATNVRLEGLQQSADSLLDAATALENNVRRETQYWNQVLTISEEGWNVCRIPGQQHRLGVSFNFSESAPEFFRRGLAALNASSDGSISLERGIGSKPRALRVHLRRNGIAVGVSELPNIIDAAEATLEARIRYARDSLLDEELCHEMIRESRTIASLGVGMKGSTIEIGSGNTAESDLDVSIELVSLTEIQPESEQTSDVDNALAQAMLLTARLLLGQAHREKLKKRSEIPLPMSDKRKDERPVLPILRPIMAFLMHRTTVEQLNQYTTSTSRILKAAQIEHSLELSKLDLPLQAESTDVATLITSFMQPWVSNAQIIVKSPGLRQIKIGFKAETTLAQGFGSRLFFAIEEHYESTQLDSMDELTSAADAKIASALAKMLRDTLAGQWNFKENYAQLTKEWVSGEDIQSLWVEFNSGEQMLRLKSLHGEAEWAVNGQRSEDNFWEAKDELVRRGEPRV